MSTLAGTPAPGPAARLGRTVRAARRPTTVLAGALVGLLTLLVLLPLVQLVLVTLQGDGLAAWRDVLASPLSANLFWEPLRNTLLVGAAVAAGAVVLGGGMAWLVVMTDVPGRRVLGFLATIPFILPGIALALSWEAVFRNGLIGGRVGLLTELGFAVPDWLSWGGVPVTLTLIAHYYSLVFLLVAAALATVNADLAEAAEMTGAGRWRVAAGITLPIVRPALVAATLLAFAEAVSSFAEPALLGLPVRFYTLSTRLYGAISTGQTERGFVLAVLLIVVAASVLWASSRLTSGRRSFATITGKGGRQRRLALGPWRLPAAVTAGVLCTVTTIIPGLVLVLTSLSRRTGSLTGGVTTHYWIGESTPGFAQGLSGVLRNQQVYAAGRTTILLGLSVAVGAAVLGLLIGYVVTRGKGSRVAGLVGTLAFVPFLIPGLAFGAVYISQFGQRIGPLPALYGTFALLVLAGVAYTLPFAAQSGRGAVSQVAVELEESAILTGAGLARRLGRIVAPLAVRAMLAGAVLAFVKMVRDLSLVVLLVTPTTPVLSVITFRYASEGFAQFANAITVIIAAISIAATLLAQRLQGAVQPWTEH